RVRAFLDTLQTLVEQAGVGTIEREGDGRRVTHTAGDQRALLAPSLDALRECVASIPNLDVQFPGRDDYLKVGYAIKAAAGQDNEEDGCELFVEWAAKWDGGVTPPELAREDFRRMTGKSSVGWSYLAELARQHGFNDAGYVFDLVEGAEPAPVTAPWARTYASVGEGFDAFNARFAVLLSGDILCITPSGYVILKRNKWGTLVGNARVLVPGENAPKPLAPLWLASAGRRTISKLVFDPTLPPLSFVPNGDDLPAFNTFPGLALKPSANGLWTLFERHLREIVANGDEALFQWIVHWLAAMVQHPERIPGTVLALLGPQGAGKDIVGRVMARILGQLYVSIGNDRQLTGPFNAALQGAVLVHLEEAIFAGDPRVRSLLKYLITTLTLRIEPKGLDSYAVQSCVRLLISSNEAAFVPVETGDRRYTVVKVSDKYASGMPGREEYFAAVHQQMFDEGGCAAFLNCLLNVEVDWNLIRRPFVTPEHSEQALHSLAPDLRWFHGLLDEGGALPGAEREGAVLVDRDMLYASYAEACKAAGARRLPSRKSLTTLLQQHGVGECRPAKANRIGCRPRLYQFPALPQMRREFERRLGGPVEWSPRDGWECDAMGTDIPESTPDLKIVSAGAL
ncbi:MAG TPA: DUF5906 domain-containing protein, partial [Gemmatimonadaceae bacterium]|nr:DUF5906 domain-containing protein [Gemmatimonadaceae bacterium]